VASYFFDSSALAKSYLKEAGTAWTRTLLKPAAANTLYAVGVTEVEVISAVVRRQRAGSLSAMDAAIALADFRQDLQSEFQIVEVTAALVSSAATLVETHGLRAYDAVQLAGILEVNRTHITLNIPPITLVSADQELNTAAAAEGITVEDPNNHP
jgi:predicted nucleic acid-binding protein